MTAQEQYRVKEVDESRGPTLQEFLNRAWADGWRTMQVVPRGGSPYRWTVMLERRDPAPVRHPEILYYEGKPLSDYDQETRFQALREHTENSLFPRSPDDAKR